MKSFLSFSTLLLTCSMTFGQQIRFQNLPGRYEGHRRLHFGFSLAYNSSSFNIQLDQNHVLNKPVSILNPPVPGFTFGIIANFHLTKNIKIRTIIPTISLQERHLNYTFHDIFRTTFQHAIESANLNFPLLIKFRTNRINNYAAYTIIGAQYCLDMSSRENLAPGVPAVRIKRNNYEGTVGVGSDFFLPYFKLGVEIRYDFGLVNALIPDQNILSDPISKIFTRCWLLSFTFEG